MSLGTQSAKWSHIAWWYNDCIWLSNGISHLIFFFYSLKHGHCHTTLYIIQYRGRTTKKVKKQITGAAVKAGCEATVKVFFVCSLGITVQHFLSFCITMKNALLILPIENIFSYLGQLNSYQIIKKCLCELRGGSLPLNSFSDHDAL